MPRQRQRKGIRGRTTKSAGKIALKKVNMIIKNKELKKSDSNLSTTIGTTAVITPLSGLATGTSGSTREGNAVAFKSFLFKYSFRMNTASDANLIRVMIVQDNQVNGASFVIGDLLQDASAEHAINSPLNLDGSRRFKVLYNKVTALSIDGNQTAYREWYKKMNMYSRYSGTGSGITGIESKGLFLVYVSNVSSNIPVFVYATRLRYSDG